MWYFARFVVEVSLACFLAVSSFFFVSGLFVVSFAGISASSSILLSETGAVGATFSVFTTTVVIYFFFWGSSKDSLYVKTVAMDCERIASKRQSVPNDA